MITFDVYGSPAPQGSKSFKGMFTGKDGRQHAKLAESSKKVKPWRQDVKDAAVTARAGAPALDGPLLVEHGVHVAEADERAEAPQVVAK